MGDVLSPFAALNWTDVSVSEALRAYAAAGIPLGLVYGLGLGLVARRESGWGGYGSFARRAVRLSHVAAVMLPALAAVYASLLGTAAADAAAVWGTRLWIGGGPVLAAALAVAAFRPRLAPVVALPALACTAASLCFAWSYFAGGAR